MALIRKLKGLLYPDNQSVRQKAEQYGQVPWYFSLRFLPIVVWAIWGTADTVYALEKSADRWNAVFFMMMTMLPLIYLGVKGYRWVLLFDALYIACNLAAGLWLWLNGLLEQYAVISTIATGIFVFPVITAFRIENYRVKNKLVSERKYLPDVLKALLLVVVVFGMAVLCGIVVADREFDKAKESLLEKKVMIFIHTDGITEYCRRQGVKLTKYPQRFREEHAVQIAAVKEWIDKTVFLQSAIDKMEKEIIPKDLDAKFDRYRHSVIIMQLRKKHNIPAGEFVWKDEYDTLMSRTEYCRFLDDNYELFKGLGLFESMNQQ